MKAKRGLALAGVVLCGMIAAVVLRQQPAARFLAASHSGTSGSNYLAADSGTTTSTSIVLPAPKGPSVTEQVSALPVPQKPTLPPGAQTPAPKKGKDPIKDPLAREALAWVGCNEDAEAYWVSAINDPSLSAQERQDLIEDLNEDGLFDPKHPTVEDLPLIVNRLELIEWLAPDAMDQVNAEAFMEAYKDLVNLAHVAVGAGEPVN